MHEVSYPAKSNPSPTMGWTWFLSYIWNYPEILLAVVAFFLVHAINQRAKFLVSWPVFGMLPSLILNLHHLHDWYTRVLEKCGYTFVFNGPWFTDMEFVLTCDPANVNHITKTNFSNFPKGSDFAEMFDIFGEGITNTDFESWGAQRRIAHNLINGAKFRATVAKTSLEKVKGLLLVLTHMAQQGAVVDLQDVFQRLMFDSMCMLIFGVDAGSLSIGFPSNPFAKAMDDVQQAILFRYTMPRSLWKLLRWLRLGKEKKLRNAWKTIDSSIAQYTSVRQQKSGKPRMETEEKDGEEAGDLLSFYTDHFHEEGIAGSKSNTFLRDTSLNLMLAGRDTNTTGLTWFFYLLSKNPSVEAKILEELTENSPATDSLNENRVFGTEELGKLVYLHAALFESLRLFSPVPLIHRSVRKPDVLPSGLKVRQGMKVFFSPYAMGRMEGLWGKDCLEFKPERWISTQGSLKLEHTNKFLVFSAGPRNCLGKDLAFIQMKGVAASVLCNFHVEVLEVEAPLSTPKISIVLPMKKGLMVRIRERKW